MKLQLVKLSGNPLQNLPSYKRTAKTNWEEITGCCVSLHTSHNVFDFTMTWLVQLEVTESLEVIVKNILTAFAFFFLCYIVAIQGTSSSLLNETLIMASIKVNIPFSTVSCICLHNLPACLKRGVVFGVLRVKNLFNLLHWSHHLH